MDAFYAAQANERKASKANRIEEIKNTFYVVEENGGKVTDPERIEEIKNALTNRLGAG